MIKQTSKILWCSYCKIFKVCFGHFSTLYLKKLKHTPVKYTTLFSFSVKLNRTTILFLVIVSITYDINNGKVLTAKATVVSKPLIEDPCAKVNFDKQYSRPCIMLGRIFLKKDTVFSLNYL